MVSQPLRRLTLHGRPSKTPDMLCVSFWLLYVYLHLRSSDMEMIASTMYASP